MTLEETYDRIADDWHRDHQADDWWIQGTNKFLSLLPEHGAVLDVGCGSGVKSKYFLERGFSVVGIDLSQKLLDIAKRENPKADFRHISMTELEKVSELFDGVFSQASLLHIPKKQAGMVVQKMVDRTKPGGLLYIAVKEICEGNPDERIEKENDYGYEYERFFSYYTIPELEKYLTDAGATVVERLRNSSPSGKTVWLQIIAKKC